MEFESPRDQNRTTPHATTGMSPAELLMGRNLRDKLPRLKIPNHRETDTECQQPLRERDTLAELRQECVDSRRSAKHSNIEEGEPSSEIVLMSYRIRNCFVLLSIFVAMIFNHCFIHWVLCTM